MKYKRKDTKNGRVQYWITGENGSYHMTSKIDVPDDIMERLETEKEIDTDVKSEAPTVVIRPEDRKCFIDGKPSKFKKFLEQQTVYLCEEHQRSLTTGEVVWNMRQAGLLE